MVVQSPPTNIHDMAALGAPKREVGVVKLPTPRLESLSKTLLNIGKQIRGPHGMLAPGRDPSKLQLERLKAEHAFPMLYVKFSCKVLAKTTHSLNEGNGFLISKNR